VIQFIDIPTERTTAATDLILSIQTGLYAVMLVLNPALYNFRGILWVGFFAGVFLTAVFGTIAHGFKMSKKTNTILWQILTLCFSVCYILLFSSLSFDLFGLVAGQWSLIISSVLGAILVAFCLKFPAFIPKIIYIGVGLGVAILGAGAWLAFVVRVPGAAFLFAGMVLASVATLVEARQKFHLKLVWEFDHHTAYHFFQFLSNMCIYASVLTYFGIKA